MFKLIWLFLIILGCQNRTAVVGSIPPPPESGMVSDLGSALPWSNVQWDKELKDDIMSNQLPKTYDLKDWCNKDLTDKQLVMFYANLFVQIAKYESNWNPKTSYREGFKDGSGNFVVSSGLFQISKESANQARYNCQIKTQDELYDPLINIRCTLKIASYWIKKDRLLSSRNNEGIARYWATLRVGKQSFEKIKLSMQKLELCK
jgi:hypothetical protein